MPFVNSRFCEGCVRVEYVKELDGEVKQKLFSGKLGMGAECICKGTGSTDGSLL